MDQLDAVMPQLLAIMRPMVATMKAMKTMFWIYFTVAWGGIIYFSIIGLTHH